jgi:hypothetical protein
MRKTLQIQGFFEGKELSGLTDRIDWANRMVRVL